MAVVEDRMNATGVQGRKDVRFSGAGSFPAGNPSCYADRCLPSSPAAVCTSDQ
ncbi:hypothetical protein HispidOSU_025604, partial [Sigmodon hispidus]